MSKFKFNYKFYSGKIGAEYRKMSGRIVSFFELFTDYRICKKSLRKTIPSIDRDVKGSTSSQPMRYWSLGQVFKNINFTADDSFLDVGCGQGRVIAYLLKRKFPGKITGIEHNSVVGNKTKEWCKKYDNVNIIIGDAFELDYNPYTVLFLYRPFLPIAFYKFVDTIENNLQHPITLYYYADSESGSYLKNRVGWEKIKRSIVFKNGPICVEYWPQSYSIWTYTPQKEEKL